MRVLLMFDDRDFDPDHAERPGDADLIQDLDLSAVWTAAAQGDEMVRAAMRTAMLEPLTEPAQIAYRQDAFADCRAQPAVIRELYQLATQALVEERKIYRAGFLSRSSQALLNRSVTALTMFVSMLERLHGLSRRHASAFTSPGLVRFFATLDAELDEGYFQEVRDHLRTLRFRKGLLASARLGRHSQGVDYVLRVPRRENLRHLLPRRASVKGPAYTYIIPPDDAGGAEDLAGLRDRILTLAADAVSQAADHTLSFFTALRAELAFYVGCLNLHDRLASRGVSQCRPVPRPSGTGVLTAQGLIDPSLALRTRAHVQGNDLHADGKPLVFMTGANEGGKSTLMRSVGLAHLMMQAGMPVAAEALSAATVASVFTHYAREEDPTMVSGKFDEELGRMSRIAQHIRPHSLLLCNESFAATNEREAAEIATDVIRAMNHAGIRIIFVTHLFELAHRFYEHDAGTTLFLRADRDEHGRRTYQLHEAPPLPTSYGRDLYEHTFGRDSTGVVRHGERAAGLTTH